MVDRAVLESSVRDGLTVREIAARVGKGHVDPATKSFQLGMAGLTRSIATMRAEAAKCVLLCANCHAEVEGGMTALL